ncbi:hypothetical protein ACIA98_36045 [Streptomyces sp. NPDC051366]|uniref:Vgb family protein n=1 Tax=Streptomyces sp. NPDC051366 TaxID=3365652 RepID=UPI0037AF0B6C
MVAVLPSTFRLPTDSITSGPDQAVWFSQLAEAAGRRRWHRTRQRRGGVHELAAASRHGPARIATGPDGALWFTRRGGIGRITVAGEVSHFPVPQAEHPSCIVAGPEGAVWFTTDTRVGRLTPSGKVTLWSLPGAEQLSALIAVPGGGFWLADRKTDMVRRFSPPK